MTRSADDTNGDTGTGTNGDGTVELDPTNELPPALRSLWRTVQIGRRAEPGMLLASFAMVMITALPDALLALWLKLLTNGVLQHRRALVMGAAIGLGASTTATWYLRVLFDRLNRRFRDRIGIALESHVARLQASVATIEHQERPDYLDRLSVLRDHVFALDHLFMSLFSVVGWIVRLVVTVVLLTSVAPVLAVLVVCALPILWTASWRPGVERAVEEQVAPRQRLARHLFVLGTTPSPGKEVRLASIGPSLMAQRRAAWESWYEPVRAARWTTALWHCASWAFFGACYVAGIVYVASHLRAGPGSVVLVLVAGSRLSQYVGAAVGELGFLRGIWLDSSRRLTWLEDYAAAADSGGGGTVPSRLSDGIRFEGVSFRYPGTERTVLDDVTVHLPAGSVVAVVGENGAGKTTLVKLLCGLYRPTAGRVAIDGVDLATLSLRDWRARLAGAFQDFARFELPAQHTVGLGELARLDDRGAAHAAVGRAGATDVVGQLPDGLDQQLGPNWDGGVELSHGQWQKFALARGFMRDEPLVLVLDEPTSALDAETEHALYERYADAARSGANAGRVTVLISHRFSTVRMADRIVVMDGARVVETGSHEELMAIQGTYAELYSIQAAAYG